jgi:hypothetical protein
MCYLCLRAELKYVHVDVLGLLMLRLPIWLADDDVATVLDKGLQHENVSTCTSRYLYLAVLVQNAATTTCMVLCYLDGDKVNSQRWVWGSICSTTPKEA